MSVSIKEAQELANKRLPIFGWVDKGNGLFTAVGPEVYGVDIVKVVDEKGSWTYKFESITPVPVAEVVEHSRPVTVRLPGK